MLSFNLNIEFIYSSFIDDAVELLNYFNEQEAQKQKEKLQSMATIIMLPHIKDEDRKRILKVLFKEEEKPLTKEQERESLLKLQSMLQ